MSEAHRKHHAASSDEGMARLKFASGGILTEHLMAFYNQPAAVKLAHHTLNLYSQTSVPYSKTTRFDNPLTRSISLNYRDISSVDHALGRRSDAVPLRIQDDVEFKKIQNDGMLIRLKAIVDQMTRIALGELDGAFTSNGTVTVGLAIPAIDMQPGAALRDAAHAFKDSLVTRKSSQHTLRLTGVEAFPYK